MDPRVTVITINFNNATGLANTIRSVADQTPEDIEYIVIDGGSIDNSRAVIESNSGFIDHWVSEPDNGIYHAMNKGIARARGRYLLYLNSGDYFNGPDSISGLFKDNPVEDIIYGDILVRKNGHTWRKAYPDTLNFEFFLRDSLPHPASLIRRTLFEKLGPYSEHHKIVSDWEFFMNAICKHNVPYRYVPHAVAVFNEDGISSNPANDNLINAEKQQILSSQYAAFLADYRTLDRFRSELINIKNSRLYKIVDRIQRSALYRSVKVNRP
jgi:glycosyltransferase involved in cell wall biosynthesis